MGQRGFTYMKEKKLRCGIFTYTNQPCVCCWVSAFCSFNTQLGIFGNLIYAPFLVKTKMSSGDESHHSLGVWLTFDFLSLFLSAF